jgi:hypothetical protein
MVVVMSNNKTKNEMSYQKQGLEKTVRLLTLCAQQCEQSGFNPRDLSRAIKTCNATFYDAVALGMFTRIGAGKYRANQHTFTIRDARKISEHRKTKPARISYNSNQNKIRAKIKWDLPPITTPDTLMDTFKAFTAEQHIAALKEMGYTGVIEKKQVINF